MTPSELKAYLNQIIQNRLYLSIMIWGAPGIGKSSIVQQVANDNQLEFIDIRLSQLAPTDLRGLPVAEAGISKWFPPEFLPHHGQGILFLDELNMSPPAMQGVAQQLILDRRVGSYTVPPNWFIWAAGNRKEDRAAVFDMPSPLANRFLHLEVSADFDSFKAYALAANLHEEIIAFLSFRTSLLHAQDSNTQQVAFPTPRTWEMASKLHTAGLDISPAVGKGAAAEFRTFLELYENLPNLTPILAGEGENIPFPKEPSARYATTIGLSVRIENITQAQNVFLWLSKVASPEWVQLFATDLFQVMRKKGQLGQLANLLKQNSDLQKFFQEFQELIA
ncbi:ATP-binding protein [Calothrix sp. NIES-3974]|uniref:ATP-binding protein n=1 Tax=Calothrix sp. NIES-3974 TaxID=2005462 RepID=UPI000B602009|nr:MoxR family ATPase [Calothrix sp. NIES-3974]BAZ07808.1 hypothetical protein NIES3974_44730 [Calothrix sp. NIES-3974]